MVDSHLAADRPSAWVVRFSSLIAHGEVLDLACGGGRHARLLAALGHRVLAVDHDPAALERAAGKGIETLLADLENGDAATTLFGASRFNGIVVTNYLHRPLFPAILDSLAPGGVLVYETFAVGNERFGKPSNPDFLLRTGELLHITAALRIVAFEDGYVEAPKPAMVQRICAVKCDFDANPAALRLP